MPKQMQAATPAAGRFLDRTLASDDRAFLVDFDAMVRLLQPLTGDRRAAVHDRTLARHGCLDR